jgi:hypothetical protein
MPRLIRDQAKNRGRVKGSIRARHFLPLAICFGWLFSA